MEIEERLLEVVDPGASDTVVLDILSNSAYIGTTADGLPRPPFRAVDGSYRINDSLTTAPPGTVPEVLET